MKDLDKAVRNVLTLIQKAEDGYAPATKWDKEKQHELAGKIESECAVLLKIMIRYCRLTSLQR